MKKLEEKKKQIAGKMNAQEREEHATSKMLKGVKAKLASAKNTSKILD